MNSDDEQKYWVPAAINIFGKPVRQHRRLSWPEHLLQEALGVKLWSEWQERLVIYDFPLSEEWRQLLTQLAGPHGKTILRAYQIKHGVEHHDT